MEVFTTIAGVREFVRSHRRGGRTIGFVPTMGALHEGHLSLMRRARDECDLVVISIFVNPTQFGPGEDFERYPRDLEGDCRKAQAVGVDAVFAPSAAEMYPDGFATFVEQEGHTVSCLEGRFRTAPTSARRTTSRPSSSDAWSATSTWRWSWWSARRFASPTAWP